MNRITDKTAIALICLITLMMSQNMAAPVLAFLCVVTASSFIQLFSGTKTAAAIILLLSVSCMFFPDVFCGMPIIFYDSLWEKKWKLVIPSLFVVFGNSSLSMSQYVITTAAAMSAFLIYLRLSKLEKTVKKLIYYRDEVAEKNLILEENNIRLAEAQNNEIHLAALRERNRIAREIHDNVGHMLIRSLLQAGALIIINKDENLKEPLQSLKDTLDTAMTSIRQSVHDLHDESFDLKKSIEDVLGTAKDKFNVEFNYDMGENISGNIKLCIAGVVKEAVNNAIKYSKGDSISVVVREHPAFCQVMIMDNGKCDEIKETGIGLKNMEDRAKSEGGNVSFTASEKGFRVFMTIPKKKE